MAIFDSVPRDIYNEAVRRAERAEEANRQLLEKYEKLVERIIDIKRHEHGMMPEGFDPEKMDAMYGLGPKTKAAVEEFASGDAELRNYLIGVAWQEMTVRHDVPTEQKDEEIAEIIKAGDRE